MSNYTIDPIRTLRNIESAHRKAGHTAQADQMREVVEMVEATAADHAAIIDAARALIAIHKRHKDLTVYSDQDYMDIWRERVDALAALVGEDK